MTTVVDGLGQLLAALVPGWDYATDRVLDPGKVPISVADMPPDPDVVVVVTTYPGGPEPDTRNGWQYPRVQLRYRATDPLAAMALEGTGFDAIQATPGRYPVPLPGGTWTLTDCYALTSEAQPIGKDTNGRWEYVRNYQLAVEPA